ncbi:MAG: hypothetical protein ACJZ49_06100 [Candidatus Thalassarchaeaceae archaeon]
MPPPLWWLILAICSLLGVVTWWGRNFTDRREFTIFTAILGSSLMVVLVIWTWMSDW